MAFLKITRFEAAPDFYLRLPRRNRELIWSLLGLITICATAVGLVVKGWNHLSMTAILLIAVAMFWEILLFRMMLRSHRAIHHLLTSEQVGPPVKGSPLGVVLGVLADVSNGALFLNFIAIAALLIAIIRIVSEH
jgi:hypothetical protein